MKQDITKDYLGGDYKVLNSFSGGMGNVFLVEKHNIPYPFVLKSYQSIEPGLKDLFVREVENWVSFGVHRNIVKALFATEIDNQLYVAAEYIKGNEDGDNSISHYIGKNIKLDTLVKWTVEFTYGMNHCISKGMRAHADIKPPNILIDSDLTLKLTDFGIAKSFLKTTNVGGGTPYYLSPEHIFSAENIDYRSDIYSFGIVLYQLISQGQYPFDLTSNDILQVHLTEKVQYIDHPFFKICEKCLQKDVNQRYQQVRELFNDCVAIAKKYNIEIPKQNITLDEKLEELYLLSTSLSSIGKSQEAYNAILQYIKVESNHSAAWTQKGRLEYEMGELEMALESTKRSVYLYQYSSAALNNLGLIYDAQSNYDDAKTCLLRAVEIAPDNTGALMNLANVLVKTNDFSESADCLLRCYELSNGKSELIQNSRNLIPQFLNNRLFDKVADLYNSIRNQDELDQSEYFNFAMCYYEQHRFKEAIDLFRIVLKYNPNDFDTIVNISKAYSFLGDFTNAIYFSNILIDKDISPLKGIIMKAQYLQKGGNYSDAFDLMTKAIMQNPTNDHLWVTYGLIQEAEGRINGAIKCYTTARQHKINKGAHLDDNNIKYLDNKIEKLVNQ